MVQAGPPVDGRHLRSERTRTAIVDALLALLEEGDVHPPTERIADRAGVSQRSVFHHFRDVEDLLATAADRQVARILPTLRPIGPEGPLADRIAAYSAQICGLYARIAPVRRAALLAERTSPIIADRLLQSRQMHRASIARVFGGDVGADHDLLAALVAATSFPMWEELVAHQGLSLAAAERIVRRSLTTLLMTPTPRIEET
jgi:AcrR family transcriptional regulator